MEHAISFDSLDDAAAFVGALSRYVSSPPGLAFGGDSVALLAWIQPPGDATRTTIYLSGEATRATTAAFGPPARAALVRAMPPLKSCIPIPLTSPRIPRGKDAILQEVARAAQRHVQREI
jgi:hypothetical protein